MAADLNRFPRKLLPGIVDIMIVIYDHQIIPEFTVFSYGDPLPYLSPFSPFPGPGETRSLFCGHISISRDIRIESPLPFALSIPYPFPVSCHDQREPFPFLKDPSVNFRNIIAALPLTDLSQKQNLLFFLCP